MPQANLFTPYIRDDGGVYYYVDASNVVQTDFEKHPLAHMPDGWMDGDVTWIRNTKYFGLDRTFTSQYKFVKDAAIILRYFQYNSGFEAKLFYIIEKWNGANGLNEEYYRGEIDLSQMSPDNPNEGLTCNLLDFSPLKYIKANENTPYEIECHSGIADAEEIGFGGTNLDATITYQIITLNYTSNSGSNKDTDFAISQIKKTGDSINVINADQSYQEYTDLGNHVLTSGNYFFKSPVEKKTVHISGTVRVSTGSVVVGSNNVLIQFYTSFGNATVIYNGSGTPFYQNPTDLDLACDIDLDIGEELYFMNSLDPDHGAGGTMNMIAYPTEFTINYKSRALPSTAFCLRPFYLFRMLVQAMTGTHYEGDSALLQTWKNLVVFSGENLRGSTDATILTSFFDFFQSFAAILCGAAGYRDSDNKVVFESKPYFFDKTHQIMDIGEVSKFVINIATSEIFNLITVGYPDQQYDQQNEQYEFNSENTFSTPVTRVQKTLNLISKYRADCFGIEFFRGDLGNTNTTDNKSNNQIFVVEVEDDNTKHLGDFTVEAPTTGVNGAFLFGNSYDIYQRYFFVGRTFSVVGTASNDGTYTITAVVLDLPNDLFVYVAETTVNEISGAKDFTFDILIPKAPDTPLSGVLDDTVYNTGISPKRNLIRNAPYFNGALWATGSEFITFVSSKKSSALSSGGIAENSNELISDLDTGYARPFIFEFDTRVPVDIITSLQNAGKGYIAFTWNGVPLEGYPMEVSVKPAFQDAQHWKLLMTSNIDPAILATINQQVLTIPNMGIISHLNGVKFVKANQTYSALNHFRQMDTDWHSERTILANYSERKIYTQKWQKADSTPIQIITDGTTFTMELIDCHQNVIDTITMTDTASSAVLSPNKLWIGEVDWSDKDPGLYYLLMTIDGVKYISEPQQMAVDWPGTLLFNCKNSTNLPDFIFVDIDNYATRIRVEGYIYDFKTGSVLTNYEDQPLDITMLYGLAYRGYALVLTAVPDYIVDKVGRMMLLDITKIDNFKFGIDKEAKWEQAAVADGSPLITASILIRESDNLPYLEI